MPMSNLTPRQRIDLLQSLNQQISTLNQCSARHEQKLHDVHLAQQLARQRLNTTHGAKTPPVWDPKKMSFPDFNTSFMIHMHNLSVPKMFWGMRLLSFLPDSAKQAYNKENPIEDLTPQSCLYADVVHFCRQHQVAYGLSDAEIRNYLVQRCRHYNIDTKTCQPMADYLADFECHINKCSVPPDELTQVWLCEKGLHPAVKPFVRIDPETRKPFTTYARLRATLVTLNDSIPAAIADWESCGITNGNDKRGRPQANPAGPSTSAAAAAPSGSNQQPNGNGKRFKPQWTQEMVDRQANGRCAFCNEVWSDQHRCQKNRQVSAIEQQPKNSELLALANMILTGTNEQQNTPNSAPAVEAAATHDAIASGSTPKGNSQTKAVLASIAAKAPASQVTEPEPTLDELIEAYVAFDELRLFEREQQARFVQACFNRASLASMQTRSKRQRTATGAATVEIQAEAKDPDHYKDSELAQEDRRILPSEFGKLQDSLGVTFTLDACANPDGSNALCTNYCSRENSFLEKDLANEVVWLNPPFANMKDYFDHFQEQKRLHPELQGCILVPKWRTTADHQLFKQMQLVTTYAKGHYLFDAPNRPTNTRRPPGKRSKLGGIPWPVHIWYCPPTPTTNIEQPTKLPMAYKCQVNGAKAVTLLDTGAKGTAFISKRFCDLFKVAPQIIPDNTPTTVELADGTEVDAFGTVTVSLHLQGLREKKLKCVVCDLTPHFDLILGSDYLVEHKAVLQLAEATCTLFTKSGQKLVIKGVPPVSTSDPSAETTATSTQNTDVAGSSETAQEKPLLTSLLLSHKQLKRVMRKPNTRAFLAYVKECPEDKQQATETFVQELLEEYSDIFSNEIPAYPTKPRDVTLTIPLEPGAKPPNRPLYRYSPTEYEAMKAYVTDLLNKKLINPSSSPFGAPMIFVPKPDGTLRMCIDYRALNKITIRNQTPLPRIDDLLDKLGGATCYTSLDLVGGYYQIPISQEDIHKTAVKTPLGLFEFRVLPQGLTNSPAVFQATMNSVFKDAIGKYVLVYLDDILIFSKTPEEHKIHLQKVLQTLRENEFYLKPTKCEFFKPELKYLGHIVSAAGIKPDPKKMEIVETWPTPKDAHQLRTFLGLANYFRKFIQGYSKVTVPLTALLKNKAVYTWTTDCQIAFDALKHALITAPVLKAPDFTKDAKGEWLHKFTVIVDASESNMAVGAVLMQGDHVIAYDSKKCTPAEQNYTVTELEMLAVVRALDIWRCYLHGPKFTLVTDHHPNTFFLSQKDIHNKRHARWADEIAMYRFEFEYRPG